MKKAFLCVMLFLLAAGIANSQTVNKGEVVPEPGQKYMALVQLSGTIQAVTYSKIDDNAVIGGDMILGTHPQVQQRSLANLMLLLGQADSSVLKDRELAALIEKLKEKIREDAEIRAAIEKDIRPWPRRRIPFAISDRFSAETRAIILEAIAHWNANTVVRLMPADATAKEVVKFELIAHKPLKPSPHCVSETCSAQGRLGYEKDFGGLVTLQGGCPLGTIIHEIGHALGLMHEHQRADRSQFLAAEKHLDYSPNYHILGMQISNSYDTCSIMHYGAWDIPACAPREPWFKLTAAGTKAHQLCSQRLPDKCRDVGQRCGLSALDRELINQLYADIPP